jgi:2-oxo-4-hydroxy-4-carboxy-5-ureidoimidazoline decarboxylase
MTLREVNRLERAEFVAAFGAVFEHSPWIAEQAFSKRPFSDPQAVIAAMLQAVHAASRDGQLALIRAHPELAGREAAAGALTAASGLEQARLGFDSLSRTEFEYLSELNRRYRERFGFPCIIALRLHRTRATVMAECERRLLNDNEREIYNALEQIGHIASGRLDRLIGKD